METFVPKGHITGPILPSFILREKVSLGAKILYALLCNYAADKAYCWPSHALLAREMGCSVSSVKNWLKELEVIQLLSIRNTVYRSSTYTLLPPRVEVASSTSSDALRRGVKFDYPQSNFGYINNSSKNLKTTPPLPPTDDAPSSRIRRTTVKRGGGFALANSDFERLWAAYPRKEAKELARSAWHRLWRSGELPALDTLLAVLDRFRVAQGWIKEHGRFVPQLVNWLRGHRWLDEISETSPSSVDALLVSPETVERVCHRMARLEEHLRADPELEAKRPDFEALLLRFPDGQRKRGPAWGLWSLLHRQGNAPRAEQADAAAEGILNFLQLWRFEQPRISGSPQQLSKTTDEWSLA